jgi:hypothetical protein
MKTDQLPVRRNPTAMHLTNKRHVLINEYKYSMGLIFIELLSNMFTKILIDSIIGMAKRYGISVFHIATSLFSQ